MKMWSGRFETAVEASFDRWQRSFPFDRRLLPYEVASSKAHAEALAEAGVLSDKELAAILAALGRLLSEGVPADTDPSIEDVHHFVERSIVAEIADVGMKLHTGRSRNELIATDLRLYTRDAIDHIHARLSALISVVVTQAEAAGTAAMPAYTHTQRAEPVLVAHWLLAYAEMFLRDIDRLESCRERLNECPLGSAAVAGTILPVNRQAIAKKLGFDGPTANSMDATSDRDFAVEFAQNAALLATHLSRLAEDLILFATQEFGFVRISDAYSTGSSALPQKKNPDALELVRAHAAAMIGNATTLLACVKGLPLAYNKDLQETQRPLFDTVDRSLSAVRIVTGVVKTLEINTARMSEAARRGGMEALAIAARISRDGVPFRRAHEMVGAAVRLALSKDCELGQLSDDDWRSCGVLLGAAELRAHMETSAVLGLHDVPGGTARARVTTAIGAARERLAALRGAVGVHS